MAASLALCALLAESLRVELSPEPLQVSNKSECDDRVFVEYHSSEWESLWLKNIKGILQPRLV